MPLDPDIQVIRINEFTNQETLSFLDELLIWSQIDNETKNITLQQLYSFINTNGTAPLLSSVYEGGQIIYVVPFGDAGLDSYANPQIAGEDFTLDLEGRPMIKQIYVNGEPTIDDAEYEVLSAGGFHLLDGNTLVEKQRYRLTLFNKINANPGSGSTNTSTAALFKGKKQISANTTLVWANDGGKIIQLRATDTQLVLTLPKIEEVAENSVIIIETAINNTVQSKIQTQTNQKIYMNNLSRSQVYMGIGEALWLYRDTDGYYVINDFGSVYKNLARPYAAYSYELNENQLLCNGAILQRSAYPRLWEKVQRLGSSLVTDAVWLLPTILSPDGTTAIQNPYKGCWSSGDGATTFRLPNLLGDFLRGVISEVGIDPKRAQNIPGARQMDQFKAHTHNVDIPAEASGQNGFGAIVDGSDDNQGTVIHATSFSVGGNETNPINTGVLWVVNY